MPRRVLPDGSVEFTHAISLDGLTPDKIMKKVTKYLGGRQCHACILEAFNHPKNSDLVTHLETNYIPDCASGESLIIDGSYMPEGSGQPAFGEELKIRFQKLKSVRYVFGFASSNGRIIDI